jgi:hypothetical protein
VEIPQGSAQKESNKRDSYISREIRNLKRLRRDIRRALCDLRAYEQILLGVKQLEATTSDNNAPNGDSQ